MHAIVAVDAEARFTSELNEDEDGEVVVALDFTDIHDQDGMSSSTQLYMDQLFQVFVDEESENRDIVIKMYLTQGQEEERFLCVDLPEKAVDFLTPTEYPPTRFVLNIPACKIRASSMQITEIERKSKDLISRVESLRNSTATHQEMIVTPPSDSFNADGKPVFFDSVQIKPNAVGATGSPEPVLFIGGARAEEEHVIAVLDQKAVIKSDQALPVLDASPASRKEGRKIGFCRIGYRYELQTFSSSYDQKCVQVEPYSTLKVRTAIAQVSSVAKFVASFTVETVEAGLVQFKTAGKLSYTEHRFDVLPQASRGCCCGADCVIF